MTKERVTISIQKALVKKIDALVDKQNIRNRSHAIESILAEAVETQLIRQAVIFIGGQEAQNALQFTGQMLATLYDALITEVFVVHGELIKNPSESLNELLPNGMTISYHITKTGSGGGLKEIANKLNDDFFIINSNINIAPDLNHIGAMHQKFAAILTLQPTDLITLTGAGVANKAIIDYIPEGFSLLEEEPLQALKDANELIIVPSVQNRSETVE